MKKYWPDYNPNAASNELLYEDADNWYACTMHDKLSNLHLAFQDTALQKYNM